ncbi:mycothiol synthase [Rhodococcus sp. NPDC058521]|uniref:mycothiol synthase n=1 Tax=Rhodococcus sp. NPDC058521 TaxID=3346536 RepID=UPI00364BD4CA
MAWTDSVDEDRIVRIRELVSSATAADGTAPVSEDAVRGLTATTGVVHRVDLDAAGNVAGYAQKRLGHGDHPDMSEVVVAPESRGRGIGTDLVSDALAQGGKGAQVWAHGDLPAAQSVARKLGLVGARELLQLRRPLTAPDLPEVTVPEGISLRTYEGPGDDAEILRVNAAAFSWHPEQGAMSAADFEQSRGEAWFDPAGLFLAFADDEPQTILGFHWTKVHPAEVGSEAIGEVYVVGISPEAQGRGLGRVLTLAGLHHLRKLQLSAVMLYVEGDNSAALHTYERLGFERFHVDLAYSYPEN